MAQNVLRFKPRAKRMQDAHRADLEQYALLLEAHGELNDPAKARRLANTLSEAIHTPLAKWKFTMLGRQESIALDDWLHDGGSKRPNLASRLLLRCEANCRLDTGEVMISRAQLARELKARPRDISSCLSDLERAGAIERKRDGRRVRIYLNPWLATGLTDRARDYTQAMTTPPLFSLIEGGAGTPSSPA